MSPANPYIDLVVRCAGPGCNKTKGPSNHWYVMVPNVSMCPHSRGGPLLMPWDDDIVRSTPVVLPLCGESCASKMISQWMSDIHTQLQEAQEEACDPPPVPLVQ